MILVKFETPSERSFGTKIYQNKTAFEQDLVDFVTSQLEDIQQWLGDNGVKCSDTSNVKTINDLKKLPDKICSDQVHPKDRYFNSVKDFVDCFEVINITDEEFAIVNKFYPIECGNWPLYTWVG